MANRMIAAFVAWKDAHPDETGGRQVPQSISPNLCACCSCTCRARCAAVEAEGLTVAVGTDRWIRCRRGSVAATPNQTVRLGLVYHKTRPRGRRKSSLHLKILGQCPPPVPAPNRTDQCASGEMAAAVSAADRRGWELRSEMPRKMMDMPNSMPPVTFSSSTRAPKTVVTTGIT